jgi:exopolysaccharide biosynthesis polyprenyl glycosylphosphotransferase
VPTQVSNGPKLITGAFRRAVPPPGDVGVRSTWTGPEIPRAFFVILDVVFMVVAFSVAYLLAPSIKNSVLTFGWLPASWELALSPDAGGDLRPLGEVPWVFLVMTGTTLLALYMLGAYRPLVRQSWLRVSLTTGLAPVVGLSAVALLLLTFRSQNWSRVFLFLFAAMAAVNLITYRLAVRWYRSKRLIAGAYSKHVLVIAPLRARTLLADYFAQVISRSEYVLEGYLDAGSDSVPIPEASSAARTLPRLGDVDDLAAILVLRPIHEVIAVVGAEHRQWLKTVIEQCDYYRVTLRIVPELLLSGSTPETSLTYRADPLGLPEIVLTPPNLDSEALFVKRVVDVIGAAAGLVVLAPLFVLIAALIKLTTPRLPVFYRWNVIGHHGKPFTGYKFSTMVADADQRKAELAQRNEMQGPVFKIKDDPRMTKVGRLLRKFSLNELPQLYSVLTGDMSLVGPRPAFPHELERYELWHKRKLCVRPGITCLWQIRGRNKIRSFDDWVKMDLEYIDRWSLWLDLKILVKTVFVVARGTGS